MGEDSILDWSRIVHKNVRSSDREEVGSVVSIAGDTLIILQGRNYEYQIPKSFVDGYNGSEVFLDVDLNDLQRYRI